MNAITRDEYAAELLKQFDHLKQWAIANWPSSASTLTAKDFSASERELSLLLGAKLHEAAPVDAQRDARIQYESVTPMPWP